MFGCRRITWPWPLQKLSVTVIRTLLQGLEGRSFKLGIINYICSILWQKRKNSTESDENMRRAALRSKTTVTSTTRNVFLILVAIMGSCLLLSFSLPSLLCKFHLRVRFRNTALKGICGALRHPNFLFIESNAEMSCCRQIKYTVIFQLLDILGKIHSRVVRMDGPKNILDMLRWFVIVIVGLFVTLHIECEGPLERLGSIAFSSFSCKYSRAIGDYVIGGGRKVDMIMDDGWDNFGRHPLEWQRSSLLTCLSNFIEMGCPG